MGAAATSPTKQIGPRGHGVRQGAIGFAARAAIQLCLLGVTIIAIRWLQVAEFGAYAIAAAFMFMFRRLFYVGPYEHMLKTPAYPALNGSCLVANAVFAAGSIVALLGLSLASELVFGTELVGSLLRWLAPSLLLSMFTSWYEAHLLRRQSIGRYYALTVIAEIIGAIAAIVSLAAGLGVYALVIQVYARLATLLGCFLWIKVEPIWSGFSRADSIRIISWSRSRYATVFVNFLSVYGSDLMLGALLSPAATGIFRAGNRIVTALSDLFAQPLQKIAQTNLAARTARGVPSDGSWLGMFSSVAAVGCAALAGLASLADLLVPAVLGEHWRPAVPIVIVMCAVRALPLLDATTVSMLVCNNRQRSVFHVQVFTAVLVLAGGLVFARIGVLAVAVALGLVLAMQSVLLCREVIRISDVGSRALVQAFTTALVPAALVILCVQLFRPFIAGDQHPWMQLAALTAVAGAGAVAGLVLVRRSVLQSARLLAPYSGGSEGQPIAQ